MCSGILIFCFLLKNILALTYSTHLATSQGGREGRGEGVGPQW